MPTRATPYPGPRTPAPVAFALLALVGTAAGCGGLPNDAEPGAGAAEGASAEDLGASAPRVVATGLEVPWEIRFLPGGDLLVTERPGRIVRLSAGGRRLRSDPVPEVRATGESGLMGLALDPAFPENGRVYVCYTAEEESGLTNRVDRFRYGEDGLSEQTPLLRAMEGAAFHDGCRLEFGPDGFLYVTMGDAGSPERAQVRSSLNGKVLRITSDGDPAAGNPFNDPVFSYGHRNPQGLAFDDAGRLWITEHGPSVVTSGRDEIDLVAAGKNHGWPEIRGDETAPGMVAPVAHSGSAPWAPAGAAWHRGRLFFGGLRGVSLYEARIPEEAIRVDGPRPADVEVIAHFADEYGRIRAVRLGPEGLLYFSTSNRDGRGRVREGDDRILAVDPEAL